MMKTNPRAVRRKAKKKKKKKDRKNTVNEGRAKKVERRVSKAHLNPRNRG